MRRQGRPHYQEEEEEEASGGRGGLVARGVVLAGGAYQLPEPILVWGRPDRDAVGSHCRALRYKVLSCTCLESRTKNKNNNLKVVENCVLLNKKICGISSSIVRSGDAIYVRVGDHDLTSRYGSPGAQTLRVATTYIHHNHNSQTLDNDIALLKLQGNAALKEGVCLVCLPSRNHMPGEIPGKRCTVTGYGYMGESGVTSVLILSSSFFVLLT